MNILQLTTRNRKIHNEMKCHKTASSAKLQIKLKMSEWINIIHFSCLLNNLTWEKGLTADALPFPDVDSWAVKYNSYFCAVIWTNE